MNIIKDGRIVEDSWRHVGDDEEIGQGPATVSLGRWRRDREDLLGRSDPVGVRLAAGDAPDSLTADLGRLPLIVLDFATLRDGRSFSHARLLRERYAYAGEIRARGEFMQDQVFFLSRLGVNAFQLTDEQVLDGALAALKEFSVVYQPAAGDAARTAIAGAVRPRY